MQLSAIISVPAPDSHLEEFCTRLGTAAWILAGEDYQLILVSAADLPDLSQIPHLTIMRLPDESLASALKVAEGSRIYLGEYSPREIPEWILPFSATLDESHGDVVYGVTEHPVNRFAGFLRQLFRKLFRQPDSEPVTAILMTSAARDALLKAQVPDLLTSRPLPLSELRQQAFTVAGFGAVTD